ncbi:RER1 protein [Salpingoeca rosetta]|uniref:Protein RER1 n=1 Tax=Salpingoeca rosetta (strain ATCC 50818 / BSB-021) TaxID=946362 RepID=F2UCI5_SALR5|nr:RER1 protein [Salpingoeca rosetta]EGD74292.1 RER1 protein [Salpingoeca rosetta]|eukprot:XP_004993192.1 RER1 protein [Salpingoeca rosetta]
MEPTTEDAAPSFTTMLFKTISIRYQLFMDSITPWVAPRWAFSVISLVLFMTRIFVLQGWYIIAYALGIYLLNLLIAFLTPRFDPAINIESEDTGDDAALPTKRDEEFRPFVRRLPEWKFWVMAQRAIFVAFFATFFKAFDVPVFWPILVLYFILLFVVSMKQRIAHMIKHRYVPFSVGKPKHAGKSDK